MALYDNVIDLIGNTPMVDISALSPNPAVRIYAKLEGQNPGGSVKDRAAKYMIEQAEKNGALSPVTPSRVLVGQHGHRPRHDLQGQGYPIKIVLPENVSVERRQALEVWGAEIIPSPRRRVQRCDAPGPAARRRAPGLVLPFQYGNDANPAPTTRARAPRSGVTSPRSRTSSPGSAPPAPSWVWARS